MASKDLHGEPFDEATIAKLGIFEAYAQAWIPTFVMSGKFREIHIFDFFAGTGYDLNNVKGSPIRILDKVESYKGYLFQKNVKIILHFNEYDEGKFSTLQYHCQKYFESRKSLKNKVEVRFYNEDFAYLFDRLTGTIRENPSLVYLDQNGIKFLAEKYVSVLEGLKTTDFLYFVSSSYFWRFGDGKEFSEYLDIDMVKAREQGYKYVHNVITDQLRLKLPANSKLKLFPFSLKKGPNIHGIIFGAKHPRAVDKFLDIVWKQNTINGSANFDIDNDSSLVQLNMFEEPKLTKIDSFKEKVRNRVLSKEICNNFDLLEFTYSEGHIPKHAADCMRDLKRQGKIDYSATSPKVNYNNVYKIKNKLTYLVRDHEKV